MAMMLARAAARSGSASGLRTGSLARATSLLLGTWRATPFSSAALDLGWWSKRTVDEIDKMDTKTVVGHLQDTLKLEEEDLDVLKKQKVSGKALLGWNERKMERDGLSRGAIEALLPLCAKLPNKGAKTVKVNLAPQAGEERIVNVTFEEVDDFKEFLRDQGAAGLRNGDNNIVRAGQFSKLKVDSVYTIEFAEGGFKSEMLEVKEYNSSTEKATVESCKHAVAQQSESIFNVALKPQEKIDDSLGKIAGKKAGDVDILFKSGPPRLHVLLERKRRISAADAVDVKAQVAATAAAYKTRGRHFEGRKEGSKEGGVECEVKSIVFAEAIAPEAVSALREAGIYVLSTADMRVLPPTK